MVGIVRGALLICELIADFAVLAIVCILLEKVYRRIRYKERMSLKTLVPHVRDMEPKGAAIWAVVLVAIVIGFCNMVLSKKMASTEIGAFYEKTEYEETYEATIYMDTKPIFCLVDMRRVLDEYDDGERTGRSLYYWIDYIHLPYGKGGEVEEEYEPEGGSSIYLPLSGENVKITLEHPADDLSKRRLDAEIVTAYGPYCGSRSGDVYHSNDCALVKNIKAENKVFFSSEAEAYALGYDWCELCCG